MDATGLRDVDNIEQHETAIVRTSVGHHDEATLDTPVVFDVSNLDVYYGTFRAVRDVSLTIHERKITAFIGPSGCGKTTLSAVLQSNERPDRDRPGARARSCIAVSICTTRGSTPSRFVAASGWCSRNRTHSRSPSTTTCPSVPRSPVSKATWTSLVEQSLTKAALWDEVKDRLKESAMSLSGGQQQRLCIARCIAVEPDVILMDEPCSALDPIATGRIEDLMQDIKDEYSIVIVTHNMQQAARVSDVTAFFTAEVNEEQDRRTGVLVEYDKTEQIFTNPNDERTENYVTGRFG